MLEDHHRAAQGQWSQHRESTIWIGTGKQFTRKLVAAGRNVNRRSTLYGWFRLQEDPPPASLARSDRGA